MPIYLKSETLSLSCEAARERLNGQTLADLTLLVEVIHQERYPLRLRTQDVTLAFRSAAGRLLFADQPHQINAQWELKLPPKLPKALRLVFVVHATFLEGMEQARFLSLEVLNARLELAVSNCSMSPGFTCSQPCLCALTRSRETSQRN